MLNPNLSRPSKTYLPNFHPPLPSSKAPPPDSSSGLLLKPPPQTFSSNLFLNPRPQLSSLPGSALWADALLRPRLQGLHRFQNFLRGWSFQLDFRQPWLHRLPALGFARPGLRINRQDRCLMLSSQSLSPVPPRNEIRDATTTPRATITT